MYVTTESIEAGEQKGRSIARVKLRVIDAVLVILCLLGVFYGFRYLGTIRSFLGIAVIAVALVIMSRPYLGMLAMIALIPGEDLTKSLIGGGHTLIWFLGLGVFPAWLLRAAIVTKKIRLVLHPALLIVTLIAWGVASYFWARESTIALQRALVLVQMVAFYIMIQDLVHDERELGTLAWVILGSGVAFSLLGISLALNAGIIRLTLTETQDPNFLGRSLGFCLLMPTYLFGRTQKHIWRIMLLMSSIVIAIAIVLTGSRGTWLALGATVIFSSLATRGRAIRFRWLILSGVLLVVLVLALNKVGLLSQFTIQRALTIFDLAANRGGAGRTNIWAVGWELVKDNPITGVGLGNFPVRFENYIEIAGMGGAYAIQVGRDPHNIYLSILGEMGLPGLMLFLAFIWILFHRLWTLRFKKSGMFGLLVLVYAVLSGLTVTVQYNEYFWVALGIAAAVLMLKEDKTYEDSCPNELVS